MLAVAGTIGVALASLRAALSEPVACVTGIAMIVDTALNAALEVLVADRGVRRNAVLFNAARGAEGRTLGAKRLIASAATFRERPGYRQAHHTQPPSPRQGELPVPPPGGFPKRPPKPPVPATPAAPPPAFPAAAEPPPAPAWPESLPAPAFGPLLPALASASSFSKSKVCRPQPPATPSAQKAAASATPRAELDGRRLITPEHTTYFRDFRWFACCFESQVLSSLRCLAARDFVPIRGSASFRYRT